MAESKIANARYVGMATSFSEEEAAILLAWIDKQNPKPSKSEAIRNFVLAALEVPDRKT
jgi:hypothetical protein